MKKNKETTKTATKAITGTKKSLQDYFWIGVGAAGAVLTLACAGLYIESQVDAQPAIKGGLVIAFLFLVIEVCSRAVKALRK